MILPGKCCIFIVENFFDRFMLFWGILFSDFRALTIQTTFAVLSPKINEAILNAQQASYH